MGSLLIAIALSTAPVIAEPGWAPFIDEEQASLDERRAALDGFPDPSDLSGTALAYGQAFAFRIYRDCLAGNALPHWRAYISAAELVDRAAAICGRDLKALQLWRAERGGRDSDPEGAQLFVNVALSNCREALESMEKGTQIPTLGGFPTLPDVSDGACRTLK